MSRLRRALMSGAIGLLAGCGTTASSPAPPGQLPAPPATPSSAPQRPLPPAYEWVRQQPLGSGWLSDVTVWEGGLAAVGSGIWLSADGASWTQVIGRLPPEANAAHGLTAVASWQGGLVAAGWRTREVGDAWIHDAAFWSSADGVDWQLTTGPEFELGESGPDGLPYRIPDLIALDDRLVAVSVGRVASVWTSADGRSWAETARLAGADGQTIVGAGATGLAAAGPGLVAVGEQGCCGQYEALVWTSADGERWRHEPGLEGQGLRGVARGPSGVIVAIAHGPGVWTSPEGTAWAWVDDQPALDKGSMSAVTATGSGVVAVGQTMCPGPVVEQTCASFWSSADGLSWERFDESGTPGAANGVAAVGNLVVVVGATDGGQQDDSDALVWMGRPLDASSR